MLSAYRGLPQDPGTGDPNDPNAQQPGQPSIQDILAALSGTAGTQAGPSQAGGGASAADILASLASPGATPAAPPPSASPPPPSPPAVTGAPAAGGAGQVPADPTGGLLGALAGRVGRLGFPGADDPTAAARQGLISAGLHMAANAGKPLAQGGGFGAIATGLEAGVGATNASLAEQQKSGEERSRDAAAASHQAAQLSLEQQRLDSENQARQGAERMRVAQEGKIAAAQHQAELADQKDQQARAAAIKNISDPAHQRTLMAALDAPKAEFWKLVNTMVADPKTTYHEVPGVGLVAVGADGKNVSTIVHEIRKPETDLFQPVVNPQTGDVASFNKRTGGVETQQANIGRRSGLLDHDAARAIGILSGGTADPDFVGAFKVMKPGPPGPDGQPTQTIDIPASIARYKQVIATPGGGAAAPPSAGAVPPEVVKSLAPDFQRLGPDGMRRQLQQRYPNANPAALDKILQALGTVATGY